MGKELTAADNGSHKQASVQEGWGSRLFASEECRMQRNGAVFWEMQSWISNHGERNEKLVRGEGASSEGCEAIDGQRLGNRGIAYEVKGGGGGTARGGTTKSTTA